jgi:type II secretory pathway pseudopilin PulG
MKKYLYSNGVSLIELLVIIAIIGIFATLGTQGYRSITTTSNFISKKTEFFQYLNNIRFRAFSENKHYRIHIANNPNNVTIELYETTANNLRWRDIDLVRRCAWQDTILAECADTFCNSNINPLLGATLNRVEIKTINTLNINECANSVCSSMKLDDGIPTTTVNICYLFDGTIALPYIANNKLFLQIASTSDNTAALNTIHKTGYVE